jgi:hypothetical protein
MFYQYGNVCSPTTEDALPIHNVTVYRAGYDCTNGGISSKEDSLLLADTVGEAKEHAEKYPHVAHRVLFVCERKVLGFSYVHAEPFNIGQFRRVGSGPMAGGNFVYSTDSRFRDTVCQYPISVHDRME